LLNATISQLAGPAVWTVTVNGTPVVNFNDATAASSTLSYSSSIANTAIIRFRNDSGTTATIHTVGGLLGEGGLVSLLNLD